MAAGDTNQALLVKIDGSAVGQVMDATEDDACVMVDCTCLDDTVTDNRAGTFDPSGSITISLKDSGTFSYTSGDVVTFQVGGLTARNMRINSLSQGGGANAANTVRLSFVSTAEGT